MADITEQYVPAGKPKNKAEAERQIAYYVTVMNDHFKKAKDIKKYILPELRKIK